MTSREFWLNALAVVSWLLFIAIFTVALTELTIRGMQ